MATKKKPVLRLKTEEREVRTPVNIRFADSERERAQALANTFTEGDFSKWVRHAALYYRPKSEELEEVENV